MAIPSPRGWETSAGLPETRYVITLDSDTESPRDAARKLVGTTGPPLNRAETRPHHPKPWSTATAYSSPASKPPGKAPAKLPSLASLAGHTGVDPYTTAVSNVYQDLFGEGAFIGKGIYDVDAFEAATRDRFPRDAILSHDLLEGTYARVGLVSDIELFEDIPSRYNVFAARAHRWVRGDWQISDWLFPRVPTAANRAPNPHHPHQSLEDTGQSAPLAGSSCDRFAASALAWLVSAFVTLSSGHRHGAGVRVSSLLSPADGPAPQAPWHALGPPLLGCV